MDSDDDFMSDVSSADDFLDTQGSDDESLGEGVFGPVPVELHERPQIPQLPHLPFALILVDLPCFPYFSRLLSQLPYSPPPIHKLTRSC